MSDPNDRSETFERHASSLRGLAYRLTGSVSESEDLLQEARIRWLGVSEPIQDPGAYLGRIVARLALDWLRSARVRREQYVGPWLPEPVTEPATSPLGTDSELAADISMALMLTLERLSPLERAAFLLRDVFDLDYSEIAEALGRQETSVRKLAERGRARVREERRRFTPSGEESQRVLTAFRSATLLGDMDSLKQVLANDVVFYSDGGGKVKAALLPIRGADKVARFFINTARKLPEPYRDSMERGVINGMPGYLHRSAEGVDQVTAFQIEDGRISAVFTIRNPDKLRHLRS